MTARSVDREVAAIARRQHGAVARRQVYAVGGSAKIIRARVGSGLWIPLAPDVYALASHPGTWERQLLAAVLGERAAMVFGRTAGALHGLATFRRGHPEVLVPIGSAHVSTIARVHESSSFRGTVVDHIPVLTVPDTFVAVAGCVSASRLRVAFETALLDRTLTMPPMQRRFLDFVGSRRPGLAVLGALIDEYSDGESIVPESVLECALYAVLGRPGMPPFRRQVPLPWAPDRRADAMLDGSPVIIEADGRRWHARHAAFGNDRQRDREGTVHGYDTLRYTYAELTGGSAAVAAEIRAVHDRYQLPSIR